ncbi:hypothetical protein D0867_14568 [Hortaea werneckii]|uniref:CENP-V/GFA domain-containing protein n=1 Tax=Hortaea werneckii TaxID=91943 RepID=A0A3M6XP03_HORWE|nr:hypothetical protein D0867_14568 [Hortaea werneckii]
MDLKMHATCHCSAITITAKPPTRRMLECQCSVCYRYGAIWAYYPLDEIAIAKKDGIDTRTYAWSKKNIEFHACGNCHCLMYWYPTDPERIKKMAINARMVVEREDLEGVEIFKEGK